jgi:hypothetical protein
LKGIGLQQQGIGREILLSAPLRDGLGGAIAKTVPAALFAGILLEGVFGQTHRWTMPRLMAHPITDGLRLISNRCSMKGGVARLE